MWTIFFISHVGLSECQQAKTRGTLVRLHNHLPHMPAHSRQSERQNIIASRTHTWQQCLVSTLEAILTTKYSFNLRQNSPLNIKNNTGYSGWIRVSVARAIIGPQSLKLAHFWSDLRWFPPHLFHYIPLHYLKRAGETVLRCFTLIRVRLHHRVLHEKADGSVRHVKSMDFIEIAEADADEGRGRGRGPV